MNAREILNLSIDEGKWEQIYDRFTEYHRLWRDAGFTRMFTQLLRDERISQHVIEYEDCERRITNLMHLAELTAQAIGRQNLSMTSLLKWFQNRQKVRNKRIEEHQLRLESDENAVKILTMHISKGLQFPVVFAPFSWYTYSEDDREILFHDEEEAWRLTLDLGSPQSQDNRLKMQMEQLAEDVRLLYVALTRARNLCYFAWGRFNSFKATSAKRSAPAYLLHTPKVDERCNPVPPTENHYNGISDQKIRRAMDELAAGANGAIAIADLPAGEGQRVQPEFVDPQSLNCRSFAATIDSSFRIASYSSLIAGLEHGAELPDYDEVDEPAPEAAEEIVEPAENSFVNFPRGTRTGTFIHSILEEMDFTETIPQVMQELAQSKMQRYGFDDEWLPGVKNLLDAVRQIQLGENLPPFQPSNEGKVKSPFEGGFSAKADPLRGRGMSEPSPQNHIPPNPPSKGGILRTPSKGGTSFTLSQVAKSQRLNELEFYFPIQSMNAAQLRKIYDEFDMSYRGNFTSRLAEVSFARLSGFMKGFIDMVFEHDGRFYIVDWKSNHLGDTAADYRPELLVNAMADSLYFLQYDLYTVALDRFLRLRYPGYRYEENFGGVYYIFLRGLSADGNTGIYFDRPAPEFIERLSRLLSSPFEGGARGMSGS
jgi:exodeoxyribonuclease V beta subunit